MFGIGGFELFLILIFAFLIFGPDKLPEIARLIGKGISRFREVKQEMDDAIGGEKIFDPNNKEEPFKNPVEVLDKMAQKQEERRNSKANSELKSSSTQASDATSGASVVSGPAKEPRDSKGLEHVSADAESNAQASVQPAQESFTERKARYERERAASKAQAAKQNAANPKQSAQVPEQASGVSSSQVALQPPTQKQGESQTQDTQKGGE